MRTTQTLRRNRRASRRRDGQPGAKQRGPVPAPLARPRPATRAGERRLRQGTGAADPAVKVLACAPTIAEGRACWCRSTWSRQSSGRPANGSERGREQVDLVAAGQVQAATSRARVRVTSRPRRGVRPRRGPGGVGAGGIERRSRPCTGDRNRSAWPASSRRFLLRPTYPARGLPLVSVPSPCASPSRSRTSPCFRSFRRASA